MAVTFPGTTIEVSALNKGSSKQMFDGIFAAGGVTLSQVSIMTGLEYYLIQNWVKRGFVSSPTKRLYSRQQFARIIIINMLRETLPIEKISGLIHIIGGDPNDRSDDLISDDELYHRYVDMVSETGINPQDPESVKRAADAAVSDFDEKFEGTKKQLTVILEAMFYAHSASKLIKMSEEKLAAIE